MKKWYDEEYEFEIEVVGFLRGDHTEHYCRNGEEIGDKYHCTYGCPVNADGCGICSKTMMMLYPLMEAVRSGGDLENIGGTAALRASVAVENGDAVPITWTTSNPAAATVDPFGLVTAVGDGEALITATTPDGHSACCNVYCGTQVAIQEQIEADEAKIALGVLGGFAVLVGALALAVSGS